MCSRHTTARPSLRRSTRQGDGTYLSAYDKRLSLVALGTANDDWLLTAGDGHAERYKKINNEFKLISSTSADGDIATYEYNTVNKLSKIRDGLGRVIEVKWGDDGIVALEAASGGVRYRYGQAISNGSPIAGMARLIGIDYTGPDQQVIASKSYLYEDENNSYLLTGIIDENKVRLATYRYDASGLTVSSEHAGGVNKYLFNYPSNTVRHVTDPLGTERSYALEVTRSTRGVVAAESQPAGAGCSAGASGRTYCSEGLLTSATDFNGQKICYLNDYARGVETRRIEGLTANAMCPSDASSIASTARMISTRWHPHKYFESSIAEPNLITNYIYNGEIGLDGKVVSCAPAEAILPDGKPIAVLCIISQQATSDANGKQGFAAARVGSSQTWDYTYDSHGNMLSKRGPVKANGVREAIQLSYYSDSNESHMRDDLAKVVSANGGTTEFSAYTPEGKIKKVILDSGQTLKFEYNHRQQIVTQTIDDLTGSSETTQYSYDAVGQIRQTTLPDGSTMS